MSTAQSTFIEGMKQDFSPLMTPNNILTDALNATIITYNGNEFILQQDMGNGKIETAFLPKGFVPVGIKEHGGIIYVASYNPLTQMSQVGSFPSPERNISMDENGGGNNSLTFKLDEFYDGGNTDWLICTKITLTKVFTMKDIIRPGDSYYIWTSSQDNIDYADTDSNNLIDYVLGVQNKDGQVVNLRSSSEEIQDESWIKDTAAITGQPESYDIYNSKIAGTLCITANLPCIDGISVTSNNIVTESGEGDSKKTTKSIKLTVEPTWTNDRDMEWYQGFRLQYDDKDLFYKWTVDEQNGGYYLAGSKTHYTSIDQKNHHSSFSESNFEIEDIILAEEKPGESPTSKIITFTITPIMANGLVEYLSQTLTIDVAKIGTGEISLTKWQFMSDIDSGITNIRMNLSYYPKPNETITNINLKFYSYDDWYTQVKINGGEYTPTPKYTYSLEKNNSYNGNFAIALQDYQLPTKEMYIVVIKYNKVTNSVIEGINNSDEQNDIILDIRGLLATEMYNEQYVTGNDSNEPNGKAKLFFDEYTQLPVEGEYKVINSVPTITNTTRGFTEDSAGTTSDDGREDKTNNTVTTKLTFEKINNIDFKKQLYPFNNINASNLELDLKGQIGNMDAGIYEQTPNNYIDPNSKKVECEEQLSTILFTINYNELFPITYSTKALENIYNFTNINLVEYSGENPSGWALVLANYSDDNNQRGLAITQKFTNITDANAKIDVSQEGDWGGNETGENGDFAYCKILRNGEHVTNFIFWNVEPRGDNKPEVDSWMKNFNGSNIWGKWSGGISTNSFLILKLGPGVADMSKANSRWSAGAGLYKDGSLKNLQANTLRDGSGSITSSTYYTLLYQNDANLVFTDVAFTSSSSLKNALKCFYTVNDNNTGTENLPKFYPVDTVSTTEYYYTITQPYKINRIKNTNIFYKDNTQYSTQFSNDWINEIFLKLNLTTIADTENLKILIINEENYLKNLGQTLQFSFTVQVTNFEEIENHYYVQEEGIILVDGHSTAIENLTPDSVVTSETILYKINNKFYSNNGSLPGGVAILNESITPSGGNIRFSPPTSATKTIDNAPRDYIKNYSGYILAAKSKYASTQGTKLAPVLLNGVGQGFFNFFYDCGITTNIEQLPKS